MKPFIKWAGGKRWLLSNPKFELPNFTGRYIEPFLGGGAMFFHIKPEKAIISDINSRLIDVYEAIQKDWVKVEKELRKLQSQHSKSFYYEERARRRRTLYGRAAQFLYLNRTCWNGLYRENLKGEFNVPIGTKSNILSEDDDFGTVSDLLANVKILTSDFEPIVREARAGDLLFLDPPYTTAHNKNGFVKYNQNIFSWSDQERLREAVKFSVDNGAKVVLTNADHESIHRLYEGIGERQVISRPSVIAGNKMHRKVTTEALYIIGG